MREGRRETGMLNGHVLHDYRPQGEGNIFTRVFLSTTGLMDTGSLLGLALLRRGRYASHWNAFLLRVCSHVKFNQSDIATNIKALVLTLTLKRSVWTNLYIIDHSSWLNLSLVRFLPLLTKSPHMCHISQYWLATSWTIFCDWKPIKLERYNFIKKSRIWSRFVGQLIPLFRLLVTSAVDSKARVDSLTCVLCCLDGILRFTSGPCERTLFRLLCYV